MQPIEPTVVPLEVCIALNEAITKAKIINETMVQRISKLNNDYRRTINNFYVDYIDYRKLIDAHFDLDTSPKSSSMILISNIFKENEVQFFEMIKFFKNNPSKLAEVLVDSLSSDRVQRILDFVYQGLFPCFLNSTCWCRQNLKIFSFTQRAVLREFQTVSESQNFVDVSNIADKILKALLKKSDTYRFYRTLLVKSAKILIDQTFADRKGPMDYHIKANHFEEKLKGDKKVVGPFLQSKKYKAIIEEYWTRKEVSFGQFTRLIGSTEPRADEQSAKDKLMRNLSICYRVSMPVPSDRETTPPSSPPSQPPEASRVFVKMLIKVVSKFLPMEVKHFFYLMRIVCDCLQSPYPKVVSMYFIRGILISLAENLEEYFNFEESKILDRNNIRCLIDHIISQCAGLLDLKMGAQSLEAFLDALTDIPDHIKHIDIDQVQEFRDSVASQLKDISYIEFVKGQLLGNPGANPAYTLPSHGVIPAERTENLLIRKRSMGHKLKKTKSVIISNNSGVIKKELKELNKDFYKDCNFHTETICMALSELAELVDLYNQTRESNDSSMSLDLYNNLSDILKNSETENAKYANDKNIYIVFYDNITNADGVKKIGKPNSQHPVCNILSNEFVSKELLERFSERSFRDLVNYGLHNWMFDDPSHFESKADFALYKYDQQLKHIFIGKRGDKAFGKAALALRPVKSDKLPTSKLKPDPSGTDSKDPQDNPDAPPTQPTQLTQSLSPDDKDTASQTRPSEDQPDQPSLLDRLRNSILFYNAFDSEITTRNYQLGAKKHEIFVATNECHKLKEFRKSIIEIKICKDFEKLVREFNLDICITCDASLVQKNSTVNYQGTRGVHCLRPKKHANWSDIFNSATGEVTNRVSLSETNHFHFQKLHEVFQFLNTARIPQLFVEQQRHTDLLQALVQGSVQMYEAQLERISEKHLLAEYKKMAGKEQTVTALFTNFISSKFNAHLFPQNLTLLDDGFRITCEVLGYLKLSDFGKVKNSDLVQANLQNPIKKISKLSTVLSYVSIMNTLQEVLQKISGIISGINKAGAGGDDLSPTFLYCVIQAKPTNWVSMWKFLDLFMHSSNSKGWQGYILTQVEISIHKIEHWIDDNLKSVVDQGKVSEAELDSGITQLK